MRIQNWKVFSSVMESSLYQFWVLLVAPNSSFCLSKPKVFASMAELQESNSAMASGEVPGHGHGDSELLNDRYFTAPCRTSRTSRTSRTMDPVVQMLVLCCTKHVDVSRKPQPSLQRRWPWRHQRHQGSWIYGTNQVTGVESSNVSETLRPCRSSASISKNACWNWSLPRRKNLSMASICLLKSPKTVVDVALSGKKSNQHFLET